MNGVDGATKKRKEEEKKHGENKRCHRQKSSSALAHGNAPTKRVVHVEGIEEGIWWGEHMVLLCA